MTIKNIVLVPAFLAVASTSLMAVTVEATYKGLSSGPLRSARLASLPKGTLLRAGSLSITTKQVATDIATADLSVKDQLQKNQFFVLEQLATRSLLAREARTWAKANNPTAAKQPEDALIRAYLESRKKNVSVSDLEARAFYSANKDMVSGSAYEAVAEGIKSFLLSQKQQEAVDSHVQSLSGRHTVEVDTAWLKVQAPPALNNIVDRSRRSGKPAMIDFGASGCRPCDMMAPILKELKTKYAGRCTVDFVQVREQQILGARYGINSIPVQIFFDKNGKEVSRHVGFMSKDQILARLSGMGVK
jgi:thioredoxin 1